MIFDCRAGKAEGWRYLIVNYVPVIRWLLAHYYPDRASDIKLIDRVLGVLKQPAHPLYTAEHVTERQFIAALRQEVVAAVEGERASTASDILLDLDTLTKAFEPLTAMERQFVWLESMDWDAEASARMINIEASTVSAARSRAGELLRQNLDHWTQGLVGRNGLELGRLAVAAKGERCMDARMFLDAIDGRITWSRKHDLDFHVAACWHCVDHFCRIREADFAIRETKALTDDEAEPLREMLNVPRAPRKGGLFSRLLAR
ncbi:MAG: hypothetical protein JNL98_15320 [Bryobacterales bacterium]|nr:hypothetical protein [Bryobacterales bacterium]